MNYRFLLVIFMITQISVCAQEQRYYLFGWDDKYGIVDDEGNEFIEPKYDQEVSTIAYNSDYLGLKNQNEEAIIIQKQTGKVEYFKYLQDANNIIIENMRYIYAYDDDTAFLMDYYDLGKRKLFPKKYFYLRQVGDYLIGYLDDVNAINHIEVLNTTNFKSKVIKRNVKKIDQYENARDQKFVYAIIVTDSTYIYDENLRLISVAQQELNEFKQISDYLRVKKGVDIEEMAYPNVSTMVAPPPEYPFINTRKESNKDDNTVIYIFHSKEKFNPMFQFKRYKNLDNKVTIDRYTNRIESRHKEKGSRTTTNFLFYVDIKNNIVLLPERYWKEIGLEMLNINKTDGGNIDSTSFYINENSSNNPKPYIFEPFYVDREDGFYEVIQVDIDNHTNDVILANKPIISKNDIEQAISDVDGQFNIPVIKIKLNESGTIKFSEATERNLGKPIAIVVDKTVISMPNVTSKIPSGRAYITGNFTIEETNEIAKKLEQK